jgi:dihydrofolate reductase
MGETLPELHKSHPDAWLIGGPVTATAALNLSAVDTVYICHNSAMLCDGIKFTLQDIIDAKMYLVTTARLSGVHVFVYKIREEKQ